MMLEGLIGITKSSYTGDDLISRQALKAKAHIFFGHSVVFESQIDVLQSADAVEVVRCKDCKWHLNGHLCKQLSQYGSIETPSDFYCGFGERREP